jgi:hypothetical protein
MMQCPAPPTAWPQPMAVAVWILWLAAGGHGQSAASLEPIIDPSQWKITFPVAGPEGKAREVANPGFSSFLKNNCEFPDGLNAYCYGTGDGLAFKTGYTGVTTSPRTRFSRTELREMNGSEEANWTLAQTGRMVARLKITALEGTANKLFFMQIHGKAPESLPLLKCIWEKGWIRLLTKSGRKLKDLSRQQHYTQVGLDEWFTCSIRAGPDSLNILINGKTVESFGRDVLDCWPSENTYYFKAGNYLQDDTPGAGATVVFSSITVSHGETPPADSPPRESKQEPAPHP